MKTQHFDIAIVKSMDCTIHVYLGGVFFELKGKDGLRWNFASC